MAIVELLPDTKEVVRSQKTYQEKDDSSLLSEEEIQAQIAEYEEKFGMSSQEFLQQMQDGTAPDTFETMYWMGLLRHLSRVS